MLLTQSARAGLSYSDFWKLTPREWAAWMGGYALKEQDAWRRTRTLYALMYNLHVEPRYQKTPEELIPLPDDEPTEKKPHAKVLTDEEREELVRKYGLKKG